MDKSALENQTRNQSKTVSAILKEACHPRFAVRHIDFDRPLNMIRGVRGAGKTFSVLHALAATEKRFSYIDFSQSPGKKSNVAPESLYESLAMVYGDYSVVVIDECICHNDIESIFQWYVSRGISVVGIYSGMQALPLNDIEAATATFYPLSFSEYCLWHNVQTEERDINDTVAIRNAFNDFAIRGGFPEMQQKIKLQRTKGVIEKKIIENDIKGAFRKDKVQELHAAAKMLLGHSSELVNYKKIAERLEIGSEITAKKYVEAIKESGCLYTVARFGQFYKQRTIFEKIYVADPAFIPDAESQKKLEAIVYMQLHRFCERNGYRMHYYANRTTECDFALCVDRKMRTIIQVIADYSDSDLIKEKIKGLIAMSKATGCDRLYILTDSDSDTITTKDLVVEVVPVYKFLLDRSHKIVNN